ncbi:MAG: LysR family transcriptional regulator [Myxococcota bacterium]
MDLMQLRYFLESARSGSMTGAARRLGVRQPTVSVAIKHLESSLDTTLFQRNSSGVELTRAGKELLRPAEEITHALDRVTERILNLSRGAGGPVVMGCHESLGIYFLPQLLAKTLKEIPEFDIRLRNGSSSSILEAVVSRDIDLGIVVNPERHPDLVLVELFRDAVDIFVRSPRDSRVSARVESFYGEEGSFFSHLGEARRYLETHPLIYPGRVTECSLLLRRLAEVGLEPPRQLQCGDFGLAKGLALAGVGPALLPRRIARHGTPQALRRLCHVLPIHLDTIYLAFRGDLQRTATVKYLKERLVRWGRSMPSVLEEEGLD